jgi:predicted amino acid-binding ACT domain protein
MGLRTKFLCLQDPVAIMVISLRLFSSGSARTLLVSKITSIPMKYPLAFGVVFSGIKTSCSDLLVQKVVERREEIDWKRNGAFAAFGFIYLGGVQYALYVPIFGRLFPGAAAFAAKSIPDKLRDVRGMFQLVAQVFLDQCVHHPLLYFPVFYCTREVVMQKQPDFRRCLEDYHRNLKEDLLALWTIWVPAMAINFSFMPMYARIPFVASVSLLWTCILSSMRGGDLKNASEMVGGAVTGATLFMMEDSLYTQRLFTEPISLEKDKNHVVLTASGQDRPGWVALLSRAVSNQGGSITESRMVRLGEDFIIMMHVSIEPAKTKSLLQAVQKSKDLMPLNIKSTIIKRRYTSDNMKPLSAVRVVCVGEDK